MNRKCVLLLCKQTHSNLNRHRQPVCSSITPAKPSRKKKKKRRATRSPFVLVRDLVDPGRRVVADEAQVVVGAGGRAVREVGGEQRRPVVGDDDDVVLRHVDGRGELKVAWEERKRRIGR